MNEAVITIATDLDTPFRETLQEKIMGWEDGVVKDEFMAAFGDFGIDKWILVCLFHTMDGDDGIDETV